MCDHRFESVRYSSLVTSSSTSSPAVLASNPLFTTEGLARVQAVFMSTSSSDRATTSLLGDRFGRLAPNGSGTDTAGMGSVCSVGH